MGWGETVSPMDINVYAVVTPFVLPLVMLKVMSFRGSKLRTMLKMDTEHLLRALLYMAMLLPVLPLVNSFHSCKSCPAGCLVTMIRWSRPSS